MTFNFIGNFRTAEEGSPGPIRAFYGFAEPFNFAINITGPPQLVACERSFRRSKRALDGQTQTRRLYTRLPAMPAGARTPGSVAFFSGVEPKVFEQEHFAGLRP